MQPIPLRLVRTALVWKTLESGTRLAHRFDRATQAPLQAGDCYWLESDHRITEWGHPVTRHCKVWSNCDSPHGHLHIVLPDGHQFCPQERARNCTRKDDRTHRCWIMHGEPPRIHIDKAGDTCQAGAGSILSPRGWHGFISNGHLMDHLEERRD